jgi:hypothetical protein
MYHRDLNRCRKSLLQNSTSHNGKKKSSKKLSIEGMFLNTIKGIYNKPLANIIEMGKNKPFPLKTGMKQGCLYSPLLLHKVLEFLASRIKQEKERKKSNYPYLQMI